jgi:hypothetical protein
MCNVVGCIKKSLSNLPIISGSLVSDSLESNVCNVQLDRRSKAKYKIKCWRSGDHFIVHLYHLELDGSWKLFLSLHFAV